MTINLQTVCYLRQNIQNINIHKEGADIVFSIRHPIHSYYFKVLHEVQIYIFARSFQTKYRSQEY